MTTTLVALAVIMAAIIGWLVRQTLGVRPWIEQRPLVNDVGGDGFPLPSVKIGLGVFMAVATSLFALSISAYLMRREGADWRPLAQPTVLWLNTAMLVLGSVFFERARGAARSGDASGVKFGLLAGGASTLAFLAGQLWAWRQLDAAGYYLTTNPANAFFYFLTALHALHLLGGLWVWGATALKVQRGAAVKEVRLSVELCTMYWHFLLVVWVVLFGLLLIT
jgi:cytochrome c oxidase subunit III